MGNALTNCSLKIEAGPGAVIVAIENEADPEGVETAIKVDVEIGEIDLIAKSDLVAVIDMIVSNDRKEWTAMNVLTIQAVGGIASDLILRPSA